MLANTSRMHSTSSSRLRPGPAAAMLQATRDGMG